MLAVYIPLRVRLYALGKDGSLAGTRHRSKKHFVTVARVEGHS